MTGVTSTKSNREPLYSEVLSFRFDFSLASVLQFDFLRCLCMVVVKLYVRTLIICAVYNEKIELVDLACVYVSD